MNINYYRGSVIEYQLRGGGRGSAGRLYVPLILSYSQTSSDPESSFTSQQLQSCGWKHHQTVKTSFTQSLVNYWDNLSDTRTASFFLTTHTCSYALKHFQVLDCMWNPANNFHETQETQEKKFVVSRRTEGDELLFVLFDQLLLFFGFLPVLPRVLHLHLLPSLV